MSSWTTNGQCTSGSHRPTARPALWFNDCALLELIDQASFVAGRIYLGIGTAEGDEHLAHVQQLHGALLRKGYRPSETLFYVEEDHASYDEEAWARRLRTALYFLLPCDSQE